MIEMGKKYRYRNGKPFTGRILCTDRNSEGWPVLVLLEDGCIETYTRDGHVMIQRTHDHDLIEVNEFDGLEIDDPVLVSDDNVNWIPSHYAGNEDGKILVWAGGTTSFTCKMFYNPTKVTCRFWKLPDID